MKDSRDGMPGEPAGAQQAKPQQPPLCRGGACADPAPPQERQAQDKSAPGVPSEKGAQRRAAKGAPPQERQAQDKSAPGAPSEKGAQRRASAQGKPASGPNLQRAKGERGEEPSGRAPAQSAGGRAEGLPGQQGCRPPGRQLPGAQQPPQEAQPSGPDPMDEQLSRIRMLDPTVTGWEDVFSMPQYGEFAHLVQRGCTPVQAYQLACFERIMAQRVAAARRAAALAARGKAHLSPIPAAAGDCFAVPPEVHAQYRAFFPEWSEAQIRADYRRHC